jgi:hypothetical protein
MVEVAHEALIRTWQRLRGWIDANREKLRARVAILRAKAEWEQQERREDLLLAAGFQLERARDLLADPGDLTNDDIREFIGLSIEREEKDRRQRAAALALHQARLAELEQSKTVGSQVIGIMAQSVQSPRLYYGAADSLAMALLTKGSHLPNATEYVQAVYNGLSQLRERRRIETPRSFAKQVFAVSFAPTGALIAVAVHDNILFYDTHSGECVPQRRRTRCQIDPCAAAAADNRDA